MADGKFVETAPRPTAPDTRPSAIRPELLSFMRETLAGYEELQKPVARPDNTAKPPVDMYDFYDMSDYQAGALLGVFILCALIGLVAATGIFLAGGTVVMTALGYFCPFVIWLACITGNMARKQR